MKNIILKKLSKSKKIDKLVGIKVDRLTRNNYGGFWLLNYCEEHDVKIELILEPYDVSTANGEMIFGMNLVFDQRKRKELDQELNELWKKWHYLKYTQVKPLMVI